MHMRAYISKGHYCSGVCISFVSEALCSGFGQNENVKKHNAGKLFSDLGIDLMKRLQGIFRFRNRHIRLQSLISSGSDTLGTL